MLVVTKGEESMLSKAMLEHLDWLRQNPPPVRICFSGAEALARRRRFLAGCTDVHYITDPVHPFTAEELALFRLQGRHV